jgi:hypothetical protein
MKHECGNRELRTSRLILALLSDEDWDMYEVVIREIDGCAGCWEAIAHWAISLLAGSRALAAGSREAAAGYELSGLERVLRIMNEPF